MSSATDVIKGVTETVAAYQGISPEAVEVAGVLAGKVGVVAQEALKKAPPLVGSCTTIGATIGGAIGGPAAPITAFMGAGTGAVIGCILSAIRGDFN